MENQEFKIIFGYIVPTSLLYMKPVLTTTHKKLKLNLITAQELPPHSLETFQWGYKDIL